MAVDSSRKFDAQRAAWQNRLLPLMAAVLVLGGVFFAVMSVFELRSLYERVEQRPMDIEARFAEFERSADPVALRSTDYLRFKVLSALESDALQRRYHQATATMLARVWTRQLGFITGMLLALVGAAFILGRLSESPTRLGAESQGLKGTLETSSPGIVLAVLGSALMALTIWIPFGVETRDVNVYLRAAETGLPPPSRQLPQEVSGAGLNSTTAPVSEEDIQQRERELFGTPQSD